MSAALIAESRHSHNSLFVCSVIRLNNSPTPQLRPSKVFDRQNNSVNHGQIPFNSCRVHFIHQEFDGER
jgi:hypothetical protein